MLWIKRFMVAGVALLGTTVASHANLVVNGDFETVGSDPTGIFHGSKITELPTATHKWDVFTSIPGWTTSSGAGIELQYKDGGYRVELDSDFDGNSNSGMMQTISVTDADNYLLSFWYLPRTDVEGDNGIEVYFDNVLMQLVDGVSSVITDWMLVEIDLGFLAAGDYILEFLAVGLENTMGGLLDNISIVANGPVQDTNPPPCVENCEPPCESNCEPNGDPLPVSEPGLMVLLLSGLVMFGALKRQRSRKGLPA